MKTQSREGFTLLEIMVVVLIIGMLMAVLVPRLIGPLMKTRHEIAQMQVTLLSQSLELYKLDAGNYPTSQQGLTALVREPADEPRPKDYPEEGYVNPKVLIDPWKAAYNYDRPGRHHPRTYDLYTYGGDGQPGGDGDNADIGNWESPPGER